MGAGKSLDLLRINHNYQRLNKKCILLKPSIDTRWDEDKITSRIGVSEKCGVFNPTDDLNWVITKLLTTENNNFACALVDEAQFLTPDQVWQLSRITDSYNFPVICFGLRTDSNGNVFNGSNVLLGIADEINEIVTLCHCGKKATMVLRLNVETHEVVKETNPKSNIHIGDAEYIPVCRKHWVNGNVGHE